MNSGMLLRHLHMTVNGTVQGVGFRPFVFCLATDEGLCGSVLNEGEGAIVDVQGPAAVLQRFERRLRAELPRPGKVDSVVIENLELDPELKAFCIAHSTDAGGRRMSLAPDVGTCRRCLMEMADPSDRRFDYPFINCTHCGPRYTITRSLPYDRPQTTMHSFEMCQDCRREYEDPRNRRYHAQPVACPACGPMVWLEDDTGSVIVAADRKRPGLAFTKAREMLLAGKILAIKGLGGFHLACNARDELAVARLRRGKNRARKPLAVMVRDLHCAQKIARIDKIAQETLTSVAAPIVLAPRREESGLTGKIAPGLGDIGVMLPYTPLHHLLFDAELEALVMTSGNHPSEPITTANQAAKTLLNADAFLLHDRDIHVACDDSVVRTQDHACMVIRRARGFVPQAMDGSFLPQIAAVGLGAELKSTVATLSLGELVVGRHLGDLDNPAAEEAFRDELTRMLTFGKIEPELIAVDKHPDLFSSRLGEELFAKIPMLRIQHHHAHMCAVMVEHGVHPDQEVVAVILDGLGYGDDGSIWGGEILRGSYQAYTRIGHLRQIPQPGGDSAAHEPRRMSTSLLVESGLQLKDPNRYVDELAQVCTLRLASPLTSSTGRLFDGIAALVEIAPARQDYEGEAAMLLEAAADESCTEAYPVGIDNGIIDSRDFVHAILNDKADVALKSARFHNGLAKAFAQVAIESGIKTVVLAGGAMINRLLLRRLVTELDSAGRKVLVPQKLPCGDGAISAGQIAAAVCMFATGGEKCV